MSTKQNRFTLQFSSSDKEAWEWFCAQQDKGAYIKALLLADKARQEQGDNAPEIVTRDDRLDAEWDRRLELCVAFAEEHGRLPMYNENYRGIKLGRWLDVHKKRCIEEDRQDREEKLRAIGAFDSKWERNFALLKAFREEKGRFPKPGETFRDVKLGQWLDRQRKQFTYEELTPQLERLHAIGALMDGWDRRFAMALGFIKKHGRLPEYKDTYMGYKIGRWLHDQGKAIDPAHHPLRAQKLQSVGIIPTGTVSVVSEETTEKCVCCGIDTGVPRDLHISLRSFYIEGAGQLCGNCFRNMNE